MASLTRVTPRKYVQARLRKCKRICLLFSPHTNSHLGGYYHTVWESHLCHYEHLLKRLDQQIEHARAYHSVYRVDRNECPPFLYNRTYQAQTVYATLDLHRAYTVSHMYSVPFVHKWPPLISGDLALRDPLPTELVGFPASRHLYLMYYVRSWYKSHACTVKKW